MMKELKPKDITKYCMFKTWIVHPRGFLINYIMLPTDDKQGRTTYIQAVVLERDGYRTELEALSDAKKEICDGLHKENLNIDLTGFDKLAANDSIIIVDESSSNPT